MKRSAASQLNKAFSTMIKNHFFTVEDTYEAMAQFFVSEDIITSWTTLLHLKYENFETYLSEEERLHFVADAVSEFALNREHLDPTSRLLLGGASPNVAFEKTYWSMQFPNILINNLKKGGTYGCICGNPRTGKTSLAVSLMELFISDTQLQILSNIVVKEDMEMIHFCSTLSELVRQMVTHKGWVCILDETGTFVGKKRALSTENIDFENLGRFVGKLGGRLIMVTHDMSRDVPPILQSWITEVFRKIKLDEMYAILNKPGGLHMNRMICDIPDSNLSFISEDITSLNFDISIKKLLSEIQTMKGVEKDEQRRAVINWLDKNKKTDDDRQKAEEGVRIRAERAYGKFTTLLEKGFSKMKAYQKIAEEMNVSLDTVRSYVASVKRKGELDEEVVGVTNENGPEDTEKEDDFLEGGG